MPINACSINAYTINGRQCRSRIPVRPPVVQVFGTNNASLARDFAKVRPDLVQHVIPELETHHLEFEQPFITVSAELFGQTGMMQLDANPQLSFVSVHSFQIGPPKEPADEPIISVNISDLDI